MINYSQILSSKSRQSIARKLETPLGAITNHVILKLDITDDDMTYSGTGFQSHTEAERGEIPPIGLPGRKRRNPTDYIDGRPASVPLPVSDSVFTDPEHYQRKINEETGSPAMPGLANHAVIPSLIAEINNARSQRKCVTAQLTRWTVEQSSRKNYV